MHFYKNLVLTSFILVLEISRSSILSAPVQTNELLAEEEYLLEYGYLPETYTHSDINWEEQLKVSLMAFQAFASINITGEMNDETFRMMELPRCGNFDLVRPRISRKKRYVLEGSRWKTRTLHYNISKYPSSLSKSETDKQIRAAFTLWEKPTNLVFLSANENSSRVHIDIRFERFDHGDGDAFDGRGHITAHAFFPRSSLRGRIHFDDDEEWTVTSPWGTNLLQVATHEIGHTLGLNHSDVRHSVMSPVYFNFRPDFQLHKDDIKGIQALYGKKSTDLCDDPSIDAITTMVDGFTYIFKGPYVYQMDLQKGKISEGYPKSIAFEFPNLPERGIDTVFTRTNNITYFFQGDKFWRFSYMVMDSGFPKKISDFFEGIPSDLNAATTFSLDDKIYFFKGSQYWKFDHTKHPPVDRDYPKPVSDWKGIPEKGIDAVFRSTDQIHGPTTLFFLDNQFWRFNDKAFSVDVADPPYPRNPSHWLYGCRKVPGLPPRLTSVNQSPQYSVDKCCVCVCS